MQAITARRAATVGTGRHRIAGTPGLFVLVHKSGARSWVYRGWNGSREITRGLGSLIDVPLTAARNAAVKLRAGIIDGAELPKRAARTVTAAAVHTWQDAFDHFMTAREIKQSTADSYRSTWRVSIAPTLGARDVARTSRQDVISLITSLSGSAPKKARKVLAMAGDVAVSLGWADTNPADYRAIAAALPAIARNGSKSEGRRALPHAEISAFLANLPDGAAADALRVLALTGTRLQDVLAAEWSEIDTDASVWTVRGARHKSGKDHHVPLTAPVAAILERQRGRSERYVFPSARVASRPISGPTVRRLIAPTGAELHGLRASLKTWSAERGQDREATEAVLAHADGTTVERTYQRSNLIDRRRALLDKWAAYATA